MSTRKRKPNPDFEAIAGQLAGDLAAKWEASGYPVDMQRYADVQPSIAEAFGALVSARDQAVAAAKQARRDAWVTERGLLTWQEALECLNLSGPELHAALELELVRAVDVPSIEAGYAFLHDRVIEPRELTPADRKVIAEHVYLTRLQAAKHLGITPARFDTLRKKTGLKHARTERGESGWPLYLYRQSDIDGLRAGPDRGGPLPLPAQ